MSEGQQEKPGLTLVGDGVVTDKFDPHKHTIKLRGFMYLPIDKRLLWLRTEYPDAVIHTRDVVLNDSFAVFVCTVTLPNGASSTAHGSETKGDFKDFVEKAETKAIGRAVANLGYGIQFAEDPDEVISGGDTTFSSSPNATTVRYAPSGNGAAPHGGGRPRNNG